MADEQRALTTSHTMWAGRDAQGHGALTRQREVAERARVFRALAEESLHDAYRLAGAILRDPGEAEDAVHDAFVTGWQKWPTLRDASKFDAWFRRIVVNTCRKRLRSQKHRRSGELDESTRVAAPTPGLDVHDRLRLEQCIARLGADDRIILSLRYYRDLKVDDVALALDLSPGTVKSRLSRAHARLRAELEASERVGDTP
jgi:RNA polymerase sigma-70 factor (ECF subfamily)